MKIFLSASLKSQDSFKDKYKKLVEFLDKNGYENLNKDFNLSEKEFYESLESGKTGSYANKYSQYLEQIKQADIAIFECSFPSLAAGFLIDKALEYNKPTIGLYLKDHRSLFLAGIDNEKFHLVEYSEDDLEKTILNALSIAKDYREKRFNFFISPDLLTYLEEASKKDGITKSTFIRNLIVEHRNKRK